MALSPGDIEASTDHNSGYRIPDFNIVAAGDWSCNSNTQQTVSKMLNKDPELAIGLGDYVYNENSADCWIGKIEPLKDIFKIVIGNHEMKSLNILNQIIDYLGIDYFGENMSQYYYSFDIHNVHIVVMNDYSPISPEKNKEIYQKGSEQYNFVKNDLAQSAANPMIDWIIVAHHSQKYASTWGKILHSVDEWADIYHPLFEEYDVDLVLQGHQHNYQRTFPIKHNIENPDRPIVTDTNTRDYFDPSGQIFATVGTAGVQLQNLNGKAYYITTQIIRFGFLNIDIMKNGATLNATFFSNDGSATDQFIISK